MKKIFGERIRELRGTQKQAKIAEKLGISVAKLSRLEHGEFEPDLQTIAQTAKIFGVSADWLLGLSDERAPAPLRPTATANATAPHATATANAGLLPTDAVADLLRRVLAASSTRAADPTEERLAALERGLAALAAAIDRR